MSSWVLVHDCVDCGDGFHVSGLLVRHPSDTKAITKTKAITTWFELDMMCALRAPTAGGQYHWVYVFAHKSLQKLLSYLVGE